MTKSSSSQGMSTHYLRRRIQELASPATRAVTQPLADWSVAKVRLEGKPFSFQDHAYLRAIYDDVSPHVVLSKAAQIGGTTWAILRAFHACISGLNVLYYFPTKTDVLDFSKSRVAPLLGDNPFLSRLMKDTDTAGLKRIGDAHLYLRGMQSTVGMKSVPADMLVFDELDEAAPGAKAMAIERLAHSDYKRLIELSNPSLPDYGIDEQYQKSDQRHWTMKCTACGTWTAMDREFPTKLGQDVRILRPRPDGSIYRACSKCSAELDTEVGEWVADFPDRKIRGYRISQLFSSKVDPAEILDEYRTTRFPDRFYQLKVGIPWADLSRRVDEAAVLALCRDYPLPCVTPGSYVTMGVDTGKDLHVVLLSGPPRRSAGVWRLSALHVCQDFRDLEQLVTRYDVDRVVIDGLPETHATREFVRRDPYRRFMCFFSEQQRGAPNWNRTSSTVTINRTEALDASRQVVRDAGLELPRRGPAVQEFARHMACDAKVLDEDEDTGTKKFRYVRTGTNHFSMAFTYAWLAGMDRPIEARVIPGLF